MKRRSMLAAMTAGLIAAATAISGAGAADVIKIGVSAPKTGPLAGGAAVSLWPNIQLWAANVKAKGGIDVGGKKMAIEIVEYDDRTSNEEAVKNIQRLATQDNVDFIVAPYGTGINLAVAPLFNRYGYPQIAVTAVSDRGPEFASRWTNSFWTLGASAEFAKSVADVLKQLRDKGAIGKKVAVVNVADAFGIELANAGKPALKAAGFDIVYDSSYPLGTQDLSPVVNAAKAAAPDAFVAFSYPPDTFALTEQAKIAGLNVKAFYVGVATAFPSYAGKFGKSAEGVLGAGGVNLDDAKMQAYFKQHKEITGKDADYWASAVGYASLEILEEGIRRAGSLDKAKVVAAIKSKPIDTVVGPIDLKDNVNHKYWTVGQWQNGKFHGVASTGMAGAKPVVVKNGWE